MKIKSLNIKAISSGVRYHEQRRNWEEHSLMSFNLAKSMWFNKETRLILVCYVAFLVSMLALIIAGILYLTKPAPHSGLGTYESPRQILTIQVEQGGIVVERAIRCVEGNKVIRVAAFRSFVNIGTGTVVTDLSGQFQTRTPGCTTEEVAIQIPADVAPGVWRLQGYDQNPTNGEVRTWFSASFKVIPPK